MKRTVRLARPQDLVVFVGPSLDAAEVRAAVDCEVRGPARQGDVWRTLALQPKVLALIDGVFESQPSVWHHELLAALDAGVTVLGGGSMGALRAAELHGAGMVGVGRIFEWYREGVLVDDAEVALLHASAEHGWRPLTVPLVNVRHAAERARAAKVLGSDEAALLVAAAERLFYQDRTWPALLAAAGLPDVTRARFEKFLARTRPDLKRDDARACVAAAVKALRGRRRPVATRARSSHARRGRLEGGASLTPGGGEVPAAEVLEALRQRSDAGPLADAGLRRLLLAGWGRALGITVSDAEISQALGAWLSSLEVPEAERPAFLAASGLDEAEARILAENVALERKVLQHAARMLNDGPVWLEGLADEARLRGHWAALVAERAPRRRRATRART